MTFETVKERTRLELGDKVKQFQAVVTGDGDSRHYDLPVQVLSTEGLRVYTTAGVLIDATTYTVDVDQGVLILNTPLAEGTSLVVEGNHGRWFTDAEIEIFLNSAMMKHNHERSPAVDYTTLPPIEEHLVAILATVEALWVLANDAAYDLDIITPEGVSIPRTQRYSQIMAMIQSRQQQYEDLASMLDVGLGRIRILTLRRVSRLTNKLVPIYKPQEIDDTTEPVRVYPPIDTGQV